VAVLSSISPSQKPAGGGDFVLTCSGNLFLGTRTTPDVPTIYIDGFSYPTSCTIGTSCSCIVPASVISVAGTQDVWVREDSAGDTGHLTLTVTDAVPVITSISPTSTGTGTSATISVVGTSFKSSSLIAIDGTTVTTDFTDSSHIATHAAISFSEPGGEHVVTVQNPGIGESNGEIFLVNNPVPTFSSLFPTSKQVGDSSFTLTINGSGFVHGVQVSGNGTDPRFNTVTWISSSQITVQIQDYGLSTAGPSPFTVTNPSPGGGSVSTGSAFTIVYPAPTIDELSPTSATVGTGPISIAVFGAGFVSGVSFVNWGAISVPATFLSVNAIQFTATSSMLSVAGSFNVSVTNGAPGGGTSTTIPFVVSSNAPVLDTVIPSSQAFGSPPYSVGLYGSNFPSTGWAVYLNSTTNVTARGTFVNSGQITLALLAGDIPNADYYTLEVRNTVSGSASAVRPVTFANPVPTISALSSTTKIAGDAAFSLTVTGSNFVSSTVGFVAGSARPTVFTDASHIVISVTAQDIASPGTLAITTANGSPGGGLSNAQTLTINNATPVLSSVSPVSILIGSGNTSITLSGSSFLSTSVVKLGAAVISSVFVSANSMIATIPSGNLASIATLSITVTNPTPGGGASGAQTIAVVNPAPTITSLSPNLKNAGDAGYTQTVNGTGFRAGNSTASWNGQARTTTVTSSTSLTFGVLASDLTSVGPNNVTVTNAGPGGGTSSPSVVNAGPSNPTPTLTSTSPTNLNQNSPAQSLTVTGSNFVSGAIVRWEGNNRITSFVNSTTLTAALQSNDLAVPGSHAITVFNPTPGGGTSSAVGFVVNALNPVPTITNLSPASKVQGSSGFTLTINGTNFSTLTTASFGGSAKTVTFVGSTQITIPILAGDVATSGTIPVIVTNPAPGGGSTPASNFIVDPIANNPTPFITSLSVLAKNVGDSGFTLTVTGNNFVSGIQGKWNGSNRTTVFGSSTSLTIAITTGDLAAVGNFPVTVANPTPGGGTSNAVSFAVNALVNPIPSISSLSPGSMVRGAVTFVLSLFGVNFIPTTTVAFNGATKSTSYVSPTRVDATIPNTDIALSPGAVSRINPDEHHEVQTMNASSVRTFDAGSAVSPAITGPDPKTGWHFPADGTAEFVSGGVTIVSITPKT
jgi:hypothetical protein